MRTLPMVVAHRGASADAPENTLPAFELAWKQGADAIECDVWMTADGHLVCHHDRATDRSSGARHVIPETPLAKLQELDVGEGARIPLLSEILNTGPVGGRIFIEIKDESRIIARLAEVLSSSKRMAPVVIAFAADVLQAAAEALPDVPRLWLKELHYDGGIWYPPPSSLLVELLELGAQGMDLRACDGVTRELADKLSAHGAELHVWTVDDPDDACRYAAMGVASITTNRPGVIRAALSA